MIKNRINEKIYIGSSVNIRQRFNKHKSQLRNNKHDNPKLQLSWNKYGEKFFEFLILEEMFFSIEFFENEKKLIGEVLVNREQFYFDTMLFAKEENEKFDIMSYNIWRIASTSIGAELSEELKKICSEKIRKRLKENGTWCGKDNPMYQTNLYKLWLKKYGKEEADKRQSLMLEKQKQVQTGKKRNFSKEKLSKMAKSCIDRFSKPIMQYKNEILLNEFYSIREADRKSGVSRSSIYMSLKNNIEDNNGYFWKYKKDELKK